MRSGARADREESSGVELSCFVEMGHLTPFLGRDSQNCNSAQHHYLHNQLNKENTFQKNNQSNNTARLQMLYHHARWGEEMRLCCENR